MASFPVLRQAAPTHSPAWQAIELCERVAGGLLLIAASPLVILSAAILAGLSGRSPLIAHRRIGWRGEKLWMLKLRTMWDRREERVAGRGWIERIEDEQGPDQKRDTDPRVTNWFARFCRRHSIDELPQLWHVVRGEMALVGPRPVTASELREHYAADTDAVLSVKPGIAGLWQVSGRNRLTYAERRALDLEFVRNRTLAMYLRILMKTVLEVVRGTNSW